MHRLSFAPKKKLINTVQAIPEGFRRPKGVAIATDIDDGSKPDIDLPPPSKAGALDVTEVNKADAQANGAAEEPEAEFAKTGWAPKFGWPDVDAHEGESLLDHTTLVESQIPDTYFGGEHPRSCLALSSL